ncbi:hypothetical protein [Microbacterium azadirachtae]|uniref:hypothetical protein n=1 Tax=Microbacterium azadirachtae TaxID=582680 RepID=UPI003F754E93
MGAGGWTFGGIANSRAKKGNERAAEESRQAQVAVAEAKEANRVAVAANQLVETVIGLAIHARSPHEECLQLSFSWFVGKAVHRGSSLSARASTSLASTIDLRTVVEGDKMSVVLSWLAANWVAVAAVMISALALLHTRAAEKRRVEERERDRNEARAIREQDRKELELERAALEEDRKLRSVSFEMEYESSLGTEQWFIVRNTGTVEASFEVDLRKLARWAVRDDTVYSSMPGESAGMLLINPNERGDLPDTVTLNIKRPFEATRVVRVPRVPEAANG